MEHNQPGRPAGARLIDATPPAPCDECEHADRCADKQLACADFLDYLGIQHVRRGWSGREPSAAIWQACEEKTE